MRLQPLLLDGDWIPPHGDSASFQPANPATGEPLPELYPVSPWADLDRLLAAAARDARELVRRDPVQLAAFLEAYARLITLHAEELATQAALETGHPAHERYLQREIPRTLQQLREAAACARDQNWRLPVIDTAQDLRSQFEPLAKPVLVLGPNNFAFAYNGISGGDFAAAVATGHPVIAKAHPAHPGTTRHLAELALQALQTTGLPRATVQLFYQCHDADGLRLAGDPRLGALGFTGGERTGRALKAAADVAGIPAYLEMSGINPVFLLPGALRERPQVLVDAFGDSCLQGVGQFCTNPGLVLALASADLDLFLARTLARFARHQPGPMLTAQLPAQLDAAVARLTDGGAVLLARSPEPTEPGFRPRAALLRVDGATFLLNPTFFQTEMFGPASLVVAAADEAELLRIAASLQPSLTGALHSAHDGSDDELCARIADRLAPRVGRLLNDKMPTGVTVSPAMMHGGPFPAGGHPGFTAVGMPASLRRFAALRCYDHVRPHRLPRTLQDRNPLPGRLWRQVNGTWTTGDVLPG